MNDFKNDLPDEFKNGIEALAVGSG